MKSIEESHFETIVKAVSKLIEEEGIKEEFIHLNTDRVQLTINKLSFYGWYIDDFSKKSKININNCLKFIYSNFSEKLDLHLSEYYNNKILEIENNLKLKYPKRKDIITEAFFSHKSKLYHSSICLFITLIDGVCDDTFEAKFFMNKKHLPEIKIKLEEKNIKYSDFILSPFKNKGVINGWGKELNKYPVRLNRHEIIHGKDVNYGNEINSLKFISMLSYIDFVLNHFNSN